MSGADGGPGPSTFRATSAKDEETFARVAALVGAKFPCRGSGQWVGDMWLARCGAVHGTDRCAYPALARHEDHVTEDALFTWQDAPRGVPLDVDTAVADLIVAVDRRAHDDPASRDVADGVVRRCRYALDMAIHAAIPRLAEEADQWDRFFEAAIGAGHSVVSAEAAADCAMRVWRLRHGKKG